MAPDVVPASVKIKTKSLPNVDTDRLVRRHCWHHDTDHQDFLESLENRRPMRDRAREILNVELELIRRCEAGDPEALAWAWALAPDRALTHIHSTGAARPKDPAATHEPSRHR